MTLFGLSDIRIGSRLAVIFAVLITVILGGNGLLIWQFGMVRYETERVQAANDQVIDALRLQVLLLSFRRELADLGTQKDAVALNGAVPILRDTLLAYVTETRVALEQIPPAFQVEPAFVPTLDAIEVVFPAQLEALLGLANAGDWNAVTIRTQKEVAALEGQTAALVDAIDQEANSEKADAAAHVRQVQQRIVVLVPLDAIFTFAVATFFGRAITRSMTAVRLEERVEERTRIAQDLHDTLLQGCMSALMQLHLAVDALPSGSQAKGRFTRVVNLLRRVTEEGREAVKGFRATSGSEDLSWAFQHVAEELNAESSVECRVSVDGTPRSLHPIIRDEVYAIGREALMNAMRHSKALQIDIEIEYNLREFQLTIRDNGSGMDEKTLKAGRVGHYGLTGMRERANRIGAKVTVLSRVGSGTEIWLRVPRRIAYEPVKARPSG